jgi:large subunit ribosomal protein L25
MSDATLIAQKRSETGSGVAKRLRRAGRVPAVVYGLDAGTDSVSVPARELDHILHSASGSNTLITLQVEKSNQLTLARQVHRHPVRGTVLHVDFVRVRADQAIEAEVPIQFVGEAEGVRNGGLFEQSLFTLTVEALPGDIPNAFEHDISVLVIGDAIHVGDIAVPKGVVVLQEDDAVVAHISLPRVEEEPEVEAVEGEGEEGEAVEGATEAAASTTEEGQE